MRASGSQTGAYDSTRPIHTGLMKETTCYYPGMRASSEVLLLLEELGEANDGAVNEQAPDDRHGHGGHRDEGTVCK
jgi:hypothetical protein